MQIHLKSLTTLEFSSPPEVEVCGHFVFRKSPNLLSFLFVFFGPGLESHGFINVSGGCSSQGVSFAELFSGLQSPGGAANQ